MVKREEVDDAVLICSSISGCGKHRKRLCSWDFWLRPSAVIDL